MCGVRDAVHAPSWKSRTRLMHYWRATGSAMLNAKSLDDIVTTVTQLLPRTPADVEKNLRAALGAALARLDLVTREELDVQEAVLQRTRARLTEMEKRVAELEEKLFKK